jgi:hypothetical protein
MCIINYTIIYNCSTEQKYILGRMKHLTFYFERKSVRYLFRLLFFVLTALTFMPYLMAAIGAILAVCMLVSAFFIVPTFFIWTMLLGKDYKDRG